MSSKKNKSPKKLSLLVIYSLITALVTVFFSGPFLRALRKAYGPVVYWSLFIALAVASAMTKTREEDEEDDIDDDWDDDEDDDDDDWDDDDEDD